MTCSRSFGLSYVGGLKYVSFIFAVPCGMWVPPVMLIEARPNHPLLPYLPLQTCVVPATIEHRLRAWPATIAVRTGVLPEFQSLDVCARWPPQSAVVRLLPSFSVNCGVVRAQWYPPHEWFADAVDPNAISVARKARIN